MGHSQKAQQFAKIFQQAERASLALSGTEDGGTCNFDTPIIKLEKYSKKDLASIDKIIGKKAFSEKLRSKPWTGYRFILVETHGQANRRTRMGEAARKVFTDAGYPVVMYYQMD